MLPAASIVGASKAILSHCTEANQVPSAGSCRQRSAVGTTLASTAPRSVHVWRLFSLLVCLCALGGAMSYALFSASCWLAASFCIAMSPGADGLSQSLIHVAGRYSQIVAFRDYHQQSSWGPRSFACCVLGIHIVASFRMLPVNVSRQGPLFTQHLARSSPIFFSANGCGQRR